MSADTILDAAALDLLFLDARTYNAWLERPVDEALLRGAVELARMGPTAANCSPMRVLFVRSPEAKARLAPTLSPGNLDKTMAAPVTAILGFDPKFWEKLPVLFPHADARSWFEGKPHADGAGRLNASLQIAYLILALRGLGLDCGPMGGFDAAAVDAAFFADGSVRSMVLLNIGYGDPAKLHPRLPRLAVDEIAAFA